ncbi:MAG: glucosamine-6-phosphate isomerase [Lachnospiraceae bacterium]|nr:glucosamine-6-phosphate isomerase [Lachnospiraceae bacterium]
MHIWKDISHHEYYTYDKERLLHSPKIPIVVMEDNETVFRAMAEEMAETIKAKNSRGETTVFICPVGPVGQYPHFVELVNRERISLKNVWFINMDEYLSDKKEWIHKNHPLSFRGFMERTVYSRIHPELLMEEAQRIFPDPACPERIGKVIAELGGVDICFGGIGINGHLAFNEAEEAMSSEEFKNLPTRTLRISKETRATNAAGDFGGALEDMPVYCVTIGMREIWQSKRIRLGCFREWHKGVVRRAAYGQVEAAFPVTLLQEHQDVMIRCTELVAGSLG